MTYLDLIAFDADDTLWHNETLYRDAQEKFRQLLAHYHSSEWIDQRLYATEMRNLAHYGYGIKSFTLSMIETAIELTEGRITGSEIQIILETAKGMLAAEVQLLEHVEETLAILGKTYPMMVITKGDLLDQEAKLARSGLESYFQHVEVVNQKTAGIYMDLLKRYKIDPGRFLMVGNSLRSDILPVLELGGFAVYVPYPLLWEHENVGEVQIQSHRFFEIEHIGLLPCLVEQAIEHPSSGSPAIWIKPV
jgi:putative hydrolase of the HAD superfamily